MKFSNYIALILIILVLLVGSSCSCGGDGGTPTPSPTAGVTATPTPGPTASPTPITEYLEYMDEENGFAILYPQGWGVESSEDILALFLGGESDPICAPQVQVTNEELSQPVDVHAWFEEMKGNYNAAGGYTPISEEDVTVDGFPAIKHVCLIAVTEDVDFQAVLLYVVEDADGWTVLCLCRSDCWSQYETTFDTMIDSFQLLE